MQIFHVIVSLLRLYLPTKTQINILPKKGKRKEREEKKNLKEAIQPSQESESIG